jgi:hypothetical protein
MLAGILSAIFSTSALSLPAMNNFADFLGAVPDKNPSQSACSLNGPMPFAAVGSPKHNSSIGGKVCDAFEQISIGALIAYAKTHKLVAKELWVWTDLSRFNDASLGNLPESSTRPILTVLSFEQPDAIAHLKGMAQKNAKITRTVGGVQIYGFASDEERDPEEEDLSYITFWDNRMIASTEKRLLTEFITGTSARQLNNELLRSTAWKGVKKDAPIYGVASHSLAGEKPLSFTIKGDEFQFTIWGKPDQKTYPKGSMEADGQKHEYDEFGGRHRQSTTPNSTILSVQATDEQSADSWFFFFLGYFQGLVI